MAQKINEGRRTAHIEGDFVVFLIGARFNSKLHLARSLKDLGGRRRGMQAMLDYLVAHPEKGLLGYEMGLKTIVQYWRSFEQLEAFAKNADDPHLEVWQGQRGGHRRGRPFGPRPAARRRPHLTAPAHRSQQTDEVVTGGAACDDCRRGGSEPPRAHSRIPPLSTPHRRNPP